MRIVFIGDSITDCDRDRSDAASLGKGYVKALADKLRPIYPDTDIELINMGKSGDEIADVLARIDADALSLEPDLIVMMIGINDTVHHFREGKPIDFSAIERDFTALMKKIKDAGRTLIFLEPFLLPAPDKTRMRSTFLKEREIINRIGLEYADEFVAYDEMFNGLCESHPYREYSEDGVHPTRAGSLIIADQAIRAIRRHLI